jgi:hypothetical protein
VAERYEPRPATASGDAVVWPAQPPGPAAAPVHSLAPAYQAQSGYPVQPGPAQPGPAQPGYPAHAGGYQSQSGYVGQPGASGFGGSPGFGAVSEQAALAQMRPPSGLFPGLPPRPVYREPHPVRSGPLFAGLASGVLWFVLFGTLGRELASYAWWTIVAGITAWAVSIVLAIFGDRGVAVGIALASGFGLSIAMAVVADRWITTYNWPLW